MACSWLWFPSLLSVHTQIYSRLNEILTKRSCCPHGWLSLAGGGRGGGGSRGEGSAGLHYGQQGCVSAAPNACASHGSPAGVQADPGAPQAEWEGTGCAQDTALAGEEGERGSPLPPSPTQPHAAARVAPHSTKCFHLLLQAGNTFTRKMMQENHPCTCMRREQQRCISIPQEGAGAGVRTML